MAYSRLTGWTPWIFSIGLHLLIFAFLVIQFQGAQLSTGSIQAKAYFETSIQKSAFKAKKSLAAPKKKQTKKRVQKTQFPKPTPEAGDKKTPLTQKIIQPLQPSPENSIEGNKAEEIQDISSNGADAENGPGSLEQNRRNFADNWKLKREQAAYRETLARLVTLNWRLPPVSKKKFEILFEVLIDPKGNIKEINKIQGANLAILDSAAEKAIRQSEPFPEFPDTFSPDLLYFKAVFRFTQDLVGN